MADIIQLEPKQDFTKLAVGKIEQELKSFSGDRYAEAVKSHVASTLTHFCEESPRFAEVVYLTKRTLSDCCAEIMKGCGNCISDIDVYRGAVRNYFPNADVTFHMNIVINGDSPTQEEMDRVPKKKEPPKNAQHQQKPSKPAEKPKAPQATKMPTAVQKNRAKKKPTTDASESEMIQLTLF